MIAPADREPTEDPRAGMVPRHSCSIPGIAALVVIATAIPAAARDPVHGDDLGDYHERIVKRFDFAEPDNLGETPKYWEEFGGDAFPRFVRGGFDRRVGRESPPSFRLDANGRNVAYRYRGMETPIRPHTDYLVAGWIKPNRLNHARATMTAYYLDQEGLPLPETQRQARLVGGAGMTDGWHRVEILLPAGPREAFALGLTLWVEQAEIWNPDPRPPRHIERVDVDAGAWFDDLVIYRLPRVVLDSPTVGGVFERPAVPALTVTVTDDHPEALEGLLEVSNAEGTLVERRSVPVPSQDSRVELADLDAGWYRARLAAISGAQTVVEQSLSFAVVNKLGGDSSIPSSPFGVILESPWGGVRQAGFADSELALVASLGVGAAKLPLWTGRPEAPGLVGDPPALDALLNGLLRRRVDVTGVLGGTPPEVLKRAGPHARPLLDLLSDPVESWRGILAGSVAPYASVLTSWQLGADQADGSEMAQDARFTNVLAAVRQELLDLMTAPYITAPGSIGDDPQGRLLPAERVTLRLPRGLQPGWVAEHLEAFRGLGYLQIGAYIDPASAGYDRLARLADWSTRIVETRHAGADVVYVPAPWRWRSRPSGETTEPTEDFVAYRTIVAMLREATPDGELILENGIRALAFSQADRSVLAIWDPTSPAEGRPIDLQLGEARDTIDLRGRATPLERGPDGRHRLVLTRLPQFVRGIERWVAALGREVKLLPEVVGFSLAAHQHELRMANPGDGLLTGEVTLDTPASWQVRPRRIDFSLGPREEFRRPIELRYGLNEGAGSKTLWANVHLSGREGYHLRVPLRFELGIPDVDVWGYAVASGEGIIVRHGVRNRSAAPISFRSFAAAPGRDRQYKVIVGLGPGMTEVKEYRFGKGEELSGRAVRLGLREVSGSRLHNLDVSVP